MKKVKVTCFAIIAVFAVAACSFNGERFYDYQGYKKMLKKKDFNPIETKAVAEVIRNGEKSTVEYTYDAEDSKRWVGTYTEDIDGEEVEMTTYQPLNLKDFISTLPGSATFMKTEVDDAFKFYASKDEYRIVAEIDTDYGHQSGESKFNQDGLCVSAYSLLKDKNGEIKEEETINYTYSK